MQLETLLEEARHYAQTLHDKGRTYHEAYRIAIKRVLGYYSKKLLDTIEEHSIPQQNGRWVNLVNLNEIRKSFEV